MPNTLPRAILFLVGFAAALWMLGPLVHPRPAHGEPSPADVDLASLEAQLYEAVNRTRVQYHLHPLQRQEVLDRAARAHSRDMATRRYMSHDTPEGLNPVHRIQRAGADGFTLAGENVGMTSRGIPTTRSCRAGCCRPCTGTTCWHLPSTPQGSASPAPPTEPGTTPRSTSRIRVSRGFGREASLAEPPPAVDAFAGQGVREVGGRGRGHHANCDLGSLRTGLRSR